MDTIPCYRDLTISRKFEIARRYVESTTEAKVRKALGRDKRIFIFPSIEKYFELQCMDLHPGTAQYAYRFATHCLYCERPFGSGWSKQTTDHFFARMHSERTKCNKLVLCCGFCNHWKGSRHPLQVVKLIRRGRAPALMNEWTIAKIEKIYQEAVLNIGPDCYFERL